MSILDLTFAIAIVRLITKINNHIYFNEQIPNDLIIEHNKLLNDYNEAIKKENDGN